MIQLNKMVFFADTGRNMEIFHEKVPAIGRETIPVSWKEDMETTNELLSRAIPPLIAWYRENKKSMPWREDPTPYHVWISEIMLQQTRIEAAIPYYLRFIRELPDVAALAAVEEERLLKLWEGLGYYSRARNLKKAALVLMETYGGVLPRRPEELKKLPGIGDYTAGAIASIAYHEPAPAVDGNVLRVYARLMAMEDDIMKDTTKKKVTAVLQQAYPTGEDAARLTEGLMELGERVCIPGGVPLCERCPLSILCAAHEKGLTENLPVRSAPKARRVEERTVFLLTHEGKYALCRRASRGLLAGLWEFPNAESFMADGEISDYLAKHGCSCLVRQDGPSGLHVFSHVEWHMRGVLIRCGEESEKFVWKSREEIFASYAIPTAFRVYLEYIRKNNLS